MQAYQYIGKEYTLISLIAGEPKVKVVEGEVVESDLPERNFLRAGFQIVDGENATNTTSEKPLTKPECVAILDKAVEEGKIESYKKGDPVAKLRELVESLGNTDDNNQNENQNNTEGGNDQNENGQ
jgi:hypothetical protein